MRDRDSACSKALVHLAGVLSTKLFAIQARIEAMQHERAEAERLAKSEGLTIYLHGNAADAEAWNIAAENLDKSGFGVLPGSPDPAERDPDRLQEIREQRVDVMCECDALLLLATLDGGALDRDLVLVGKHDRQSARARTKRLLPCGVLDMVGAPVATEVRKRTARWLQAEWLDVKHQPWTSALRNWLVGRGPAQEVLR
ncbi:hypothetical protein [Paraburkholderia sp. SIMBA_054]|uniref:hypothetical protein n=1 Tax=Paraburkholderia sp. SIMBA_054 TaxID=3085795 RepID=UPI003978E9AB